MLLVTLPNGLKMWAIDRHNVRGLYRDIFEQKCYESDPLVVRNGDTVLDIGANIGFYSVALAQMHQRMRVYAFEPIPDLYEVMVKNAEMSLRGVDFKAINCGISKKAGVARFEYLPNRNLFATMRAEDVKAAAKRGIESGELQRAWIETFASLNIIPGGLSRLLLRALSHRLMKPVIVGMAVSIRGLIGFIDRFQFRYYDCTIVTLSDVLREEGISSVDLVKIDVEGSEMDVLEGIQGNDWDKIKQFVIEVHDVDGRVERMAELLRSRHYAVTVKQDELDINRIMGTYMVYAVRAA